jgi:2-polyprenyl-3-methyl-5-hydroxy-6-metoxy-1,4-benzoquinol methylase
MVAHSSRAISEHELDELRRSAEEARAYAFQPSTPDEVKRYLNPPATTPYGLEYAFHLLGDVRGKTVVDLGCGKGENLVPLAQRGANVIGLDLSPELIEWAKKRVATAGVNADIRVGSAYATGLPDESVDVVFCIALVHHLNIQQVCNEMRRIVKKTGFIVISEPVRFSQSYDRVRKLLPSKRNISEQEHPLTKTEYDCLTTDFSVESVRYFRLPFVPLIEGVTGHTNHFARVVSGKLIDHVPALQTYATSVVTRLRKVA